MTEDEWCTQNWEQSYNHCAFPRQENMYDCGVLMIKCMETTAEGLIPMAPYLSADKTSAYRCEMLAALIDNSDS